MLGEGDDELARDEVVAVSLLESAATRLRRRPLRWVLAGRLFLTTRKLSVDSNSDDGGGGRSNKFGMCTSSSRLSKLLLRDALPRLTALEYMMSVRREEGKAICLLPKIGAVEIIASSSGSGWKERATFSEDKAAVMLLLSCEEGAIAPGNVFDIFVTKAPISQ